MLDLLCTLQRRYYPTEFDCEEFFCIASALYTATIYTTMTIYLKTALGMGLKEEFDKFFEKCHSYRNSGFQTFVTVLVTFYMGIVLILF
jgi:hypothetical protein